MKSLDLFVPVTLDTQLKGYAGETIVQFRNPNVPGTTFAQFTLRDVDVTRLLRGEHVSCRFQMWEDPR